jgi:hypothetical protein
VKKNRMCELLFTSKPGTILLGAICIILFLATFGIGYLVCGLMLANHIVKKDPDSYHGSGLFGVVFIWPVALLMHALNWE